MIATDRRAEFWTYRRVWVVWAANVTACLCGGAALAATSLVLHSPAAAVAGVFLVTLAALVDRAIVPWIVRVGSRQITRRLRERRFPIL